MFVLLNIMWKETEKGEKEICHLAAMRVTERWEESGSFEITRVLESGDDRSPDDVPDDAYMKRASSESELLKKLADSLSGTDALCVYDSSEIDVLSEAWRRTFGKAVPYLTVTAGAKIYRILHPYEGEFPESLLSIYTVSWSLNIGMDLTVRCPMNSVLLLRVLLKKLGVTYKGLREESKRGEYYTTRAERNRVMLLRTEYNYIYLPDSEVFHTKDCHCVLNTDKLILGSVYYKTAAKDRRPCRVCKPVPGPETETDKAGTEKDVPEKANPEKETRSSADKQKIDNSEIIRVKLIEGYYKNIARGKVVGYCHSRLHPGCLTKTLMDEHDCVNKECRCFEKYEDAPYWAALRAKAEKKRKRKLQKKQREEAERTERQKLDNMRCDIQRLADDTDSEMLVVRIERSDRLIKIYYVSDNAFADGECFPKLFSELMRRYRGMRIYFCHIRDVDGHFVTREEYLAIRH